VRNSQAVKRIKTEARKNTRGYKMATKIQAAFRGYLFRMKRKRALAKLNFKVNSETEFDDDFDAEAFLDVKKENLEHADIFSGGLVEKYIQVLSSDYNKRKNSDMLGATRPIGEKPSGLPPLNATAKSAIIKKPFDQNAAK